MIWMMWKEANFGIYNIIAFFFSYTSDSICDMQWKLCQGKHSNSFLCGGVLFMHFNFA